MMRTIRINSAAKYHNSVEAKVSPPSPPPEDNTGKKWEIQAAFLPKLLTFHDIKMIDCRVDGDQLARVLGKNADLKVRVLAPQSIEQREDHDRIA
jgi:hypothetical protein